MNFPRLEKQRLERTGPLNKTEALEQKTQEQQRCGLENSPRALRAGHFIARIDCECKHFLRHAAGFLRSILVLLAVLAISS